MADAQATSVGGTITFGQSEASQRAFYGAALPEDLEIIHGR